MKTKKLNKKLFLNKTGIANLDADKLRPLRGGDEDDTLQETYCGLNPAYKCDCRTAFFQTCEGTGDTD